MRRTRAAALGIVALVTTSAVTSEAFAQTASGNGPMADPPLPPDDRSEVELRRPGVSYPPDALIDQKMRRSWNEGNVRTFISTTLDVGWTYIRPRASFGYGKPFGAWIGIDVNPIFSGNGVGAYGGLRFALPRIDLRIGPRYFASFNRNYLTPQSSYNRLDLDSTVGDPSRVVTYEAELEASVPLGPGDIIGLGSLSYVSIVPEGQYVFEETLRAIVAPPIVWRARGGYVVRFGSFRQHSVGIVADVLDIPKRDDSRTIRLGPVIRIVLSRRVEVRGSFVPTIIGPDYIGLLGGDFTELGFRYRWATE